MQTNILTGKKAKHTLDTLLEQADTNNALYYPAPCIAGYFKCKDVWVAFDNTTHNCWVEEFSTEEQARKYCDYENCNDITPERV